VNRHHNPTPPRVDRWWTAATTAEMFALTRGEGATFTGTWRGDDRVHYDVAFKSRGKMRHITGNLVKRPRRGDRHTWKYSHRGLTLGGRLAIFMSADGQLCALHLPANLGSDGGVIVLARAGVDHVSIRARIVDSLSDLDLTRAQFDVLEWGWCTLTSRSR
jgi:hypothetical protein